MKDTSVSLSAGSATGISIGAGGFTGDTYILTTEGATRVDALTPGMNLYALDPMTRLLKIKPLKAIQQVTFDGPLVTVETNRANLHVAPGHPILYKTKGDAQPRFQRAGDLHDRYQYKFINEWRCPRREPLETVDITELIDDYEIVAEFEEHGHTVRAMLPDGCEPIRNNSHTGYFFDPKTFKKFQSQIESAASRVTIRSGPNHWRRPYRFDGDDFIELIGWFVTEGSASRMKDSNSIDVSIAQKTQPYRDSIQALFERLEVRVAEKEGGFSFGSLLYGTLLARLCGEDSHSKRLPEFIWSLPIRQQELLLEILIAGDGNEYNTYYTASDELASDVLRLCVETGWNPRIASRRGTWSIHPAKVNDGFQSPMHVSSTSNEGPVFQLTMTDYPTVFAGRHRKFQWTGVSNVV